MAFDVYGARKAGYSDSEIADYLAAEKKFDAAKAREAGYSDKDLIKHLTIPPPPAPVKDWVPDPSAATTPDPVVDALGRVGQAAVRGFSAMPPSVLTPEAEKAVDEGGPMGRLLVNPAARMVGAGLGFGNALLQGGRQALHEATTAAGAPGLDRDINALLDVLPFAAHTPILRPNMTPEPRSPKFVSERMTPARAEGQTDLDRINQLIRHDDQEGGQPPPPSPPEARVPDAVITVRPERTAEPEPQPAAVGADITQTPIPEKTPGQAARDFDSQVKQTAAERAGPQGVDNTVYVEGVERPTAAREFSVDNSVNENAQRTTDPAFSDAIRKTEANAKEVLLDKFNEIAGDPIALERAHETRSQVSPAEMRVFENEQPVDAGNVVAAIDSILAGPSGKRTAVVSVLKDIRDSLHDANGNLEVLPSQLYGARQNITDKLKLKTGDLASNARLAKAEMQRLLEVLDPTITQGAPLFEQYLAQFADLSKPINRMEFLQDKTLGAGKITNARGEIEFARVQRLLETIARERKKPGANAAKSLEENHLQALIAIRNELAAFAHRDELARVKGSNTTQLLNAAGRTGSGPVGQGVKNAALHLAVGWIPGVGSAMEYGVKPALEARAARKTAAELAALRARLLETAPRSPLLD